MRFCPFCAKENDDEASHCTTCGKRLPARRPTGSGPVAAAVAAASAPTAVRGAQALQPSGEPAIPPVKTIFGIPTVRPTDDGAFPPIDAETSNDESTTVPVALPPPRSKVPLPTRSMGVAPLPDRVKSAAAPEAPLAETPSNETRPLSGSQLLSEEVVQPIDPLALPPMPAAPSSATLWGAVLYVHPVARAWFARRKAQAEVQAVLVEDQRALDQVLGELGRACREEGLDVPALKEEMGQLHQTEARRTKAEADSLIATQRRAQESERFSAEESGRRTEIATQEEVVRVVEGALAEKQQQQRGEQAELRRLEHEIRSLEKRATGLDAKAAKVAAGSAERLAAEGEARGTRARSSELSARRDEAASRLAGLDEPVAKLLEEVAAARAELNKRGEALATTLTARDATLREIDGDVARLTQEQEDAAAEIVRRFVTVGTLLNLNRVERARFSPLYGRIDDLKGGLTEREALITRLENERNAFDHRALQKGLIAFGSGVAVLILLLITALALLS